MRSSTTAFRCRLTSGAINLVPANAGTHMPWPLCESSMVDAFASRRPVVMGPPFRAGRRKMNHSVTAALQSTPSRGLATAKMLETTAAQPDVSTNPAAIGRRRNYVRPLLGLLLPVGLALVWEVVVGLGLSSGRLVPPPSRIFVEIVDLAKSGELLRHIVATLTRVFAGFGFGVVAGTLLGAICGYWALARRLLDPTIQALRAIPSLAW